MFTAAICVWPPVTRQRHLQRGLCECRIKAKMKIAIQYVKIKRVSDDRRKAVIIDTMNEVCIDQHTSFSTILSSQKSVAIQHSVNQ